LATELVGVLECVGSNACGLGGAERTGVIEVVWRYGDVDFVVLMAGIMVCKACYCVAHVDPDVTFVQ
jgi:hypothetical protein